jgi:hypothetical protein
LVRHAPTFAVCHATLWKQVHRRLLLLLLLLLLRPQPRTAGGCMVLMLLRQARAAAEVLLLPLLLATIQHTTSLSRLDAVCMLQHLMLLLLLLCECEIDALVGRLQDGWQVLGRPHALRQRRGDEVDVALGALEEHDQITHSHVVAHQHVALVQQKETDRHTGAAWLSERARSMCQLLVLVKLRRGCASTVHKLPGALPGCCLNTARHHLTCLGMLRSSCHSTDTPSNAM